MEGFFQGLVQVLFIYGGHTSNIEVADVMDNPADYDSTLVWLADFSPVTASHDFFW